MEKKLTDEEIVKAYELCVMDGVGCAECPYSKYAREGFGYCDGDIEEDVLDLIYRLQDENGKQKAEIERLKKQLKHLQADMKLEVGIRDKENAELQKQVDKAWFEVGKMCMEERKDTAKEILITAIQLSDMCESFYEFQNRLIDLIEVNYGLEVERKTIIPAKSVEVE